MKIFLLISVVFFSTTAFAGDVFDGVTKNLGKCFTRTYSKQHLKNHPKQTVTHMSAKLHKHVITEDDGTTWHMDLVKIQAKRRLKDGKQDNNVYGVEMACSAVSGQCAIECDGPQVDIRYSTNNPGSLLVDNSKNRLVLNPLTCGDDDLVTAVSLFLEATKGGDDIFLLHPMKDFNCL